MENRLRKDYMVLTSLCDAEGKLGLKNVFDIFMDMAAMHAGELGVGYYAMLEHRCYWVAVRTRVQIERRPRLGDVFEAVTWPGKPGLAKSDRFYRLMDEEGVFAEGLTEWAVWDLDNGSVRRTDSYGYPLDLVPSDERVCGKPFTRFHNMSAECESDVFSYTVTSMDIDVGRHMNNVAYVRMLLGTFSAAELSSMDISEAEISYRIACYEGETLCVRRSFSDNIWWFQVQKTDGDIAAHARLVLR